MSSLSVNFNKLVDLAVNPSLGTINISLLHNLLHIIIDQLQLSTKLIQFNGVESASIENFIVNSQQNCGLEINEYETKSEVDDATGNNDRKREQTQKIASNENAKLFTIRVESKVEECPKGPQLNLIQFLSNEESQKLKVDSVQDAIANVISTNRVDENSLQKMFDFINISKRIEALEIGIRQLAELLKATQCDLNRSNTSLNINRSDDMSTLHQRIQNLSEEIENLSCQCKCTREDFEENLFSNLQDKLQEFTNSVSTVKLESDNLKTFYATSLEGIQNEMTQFKDLVCKRLESHKNDLVGCMSEIQTMLDCKLDKFYVTNLKKYLEEVIHNLEKKIENVDCPKPLAAGAVKRIFKDLNCVSCGESVVQADNPNPTQSTLMINEEHPNAMQKQQQLLTLSSRACNNQAYGLSFSIRKLSKRQKPKEKGS